MKKIQPTSKITSNTGVTTRIGMMRESITAMGAYYPTAAAYYEAMLDSYEASAAQSNQEEARRSA